MANSSSKYLSPRLALREGRLKLAVEPDRIDVVARGGLLGVIAGPLLSEVCRCS